MAVECCEHVRTREGGTHCLVRVKMQNGMVENAMSIINKDVKQKLLTGLNYRCSTQPIL